MVIVYLKRTVLIMLLLVSLYGLAAFSRGKDKSVLLLQDLFTVKRIEVSGNYYLSDSDVLKIAELSAGDAIWKYSIKESEIRLARSPWIKSTHFQKKWPGAKLKLIVKEEEPWLVVELADVSWLISRSGKWICPLSSISNPKLILDISRMPRLRAGTKLISPLRKHFNYAIGLLKLISLAGDVPFQVESFEISNEGSLYVFPSLGSKANFNKVIFGKSAFEHMKESLSNLRYITKDLSERGDRVDIVDLRFAGQAVIR